MVLFVLLFLRPKKVWDWTGIKLATPDSATKIDLHQLASHKLADQDHTVLHPHHKNIMNNEIASFGLQKEKSVRNFKTFTVHLRIGPVKQTFLA